jgi:hypothetical protein
MAVYLSYTPSISYQPPYHTDQRTQGCGLDEGDAGDVAGWRCGHLGPVGFVSGAWWPAPEFRRVLCRCARHGWGWGQRRVATCCKNFFQCRVCVLCVCVSVLFSPRHPLVPTRAARLGARGRCCEDPAVGQRPCSSSSSSPCCNALLTASRVPSSHAFCEFIVK